MPSVSDLIHSSFRLIGAIAAGETLETTELSDALVSLNQMIESWNTEGMSIAGRIRQVIAVAQGNPYYTLPQRAVKIESASISISAIDCPLEIVDSAGWEAITEKAAMAVYIKKLYCDYGYPSATVYMWPVPRMSGSLELWTYQPIADFTGTSELIQLPPGYEAALRYNFAVALLPEYPRAQPDPTLAPQAQAYKASLMQLNASNHMKSQTSSPAQSAVADAAEMAAR